MQLSRAGAAMLLGHSGLVVSIAARHFEGSWGGFLIYLLDLPVSMLYLPVLESAAHQVAASLVLGGLWWYVIGAALGRAGAWLGRRLRRRTGSAA